MTTLYKPIPITSAEQAEALSVGSIAHESDPLHPCADKLRICIDRGLWCGDSYHNSRDMIGWTALVPIEAEVETVVNTADLDLDPEHEYLSDDPAPLDAIRDAPKYTRYITPWTEEEA